MSPQLHVETCARKAGENRAFSLCLIGSVCVLALATSPVKADDPVRLTTGISEAPDLLLSPDLDVRTTGATPTTVAPIRLTKRCGGGKRNATACQERGEPWERGPVFELSVDGSLMLAPPASLGEVDEVRLAYDFGGTPAQQEAARQAVDRLFEKQTKRAAQGWVRQALARAGAAAGPYAAPIGALALLWAARPDGTVAFEASDRYGDIDVQLRQYDAARRIHISARRKGSMLVGALGLQLESQTLDFDPDRSDGDRLTYSRSDGVPVLVFHREDSRWELLPDYPAPSWLKPMGIEVDADGEMRMGPPVPASRDALQQWKPERFGASPMVVFYDERSDAMTSTLLLGDGQVKLEASLAEPGADGTPQMTWHISNFEAGDLGLPKAPLLAPQPERRFVHFEDGSWEMIEKDQHGVERVVGSFYARGFDRGRTRTVSGAGRRFVRGQSNRGTFTFKDKRYGFRIEDGVFRVSVPERDPNTLELLAALHASPDVSVKRIELVQGNGNSVVAVDRGSNVIELTAPFAEGKSVAEQHPLVAELTKAACFVAGTLVHTASGPQPIEAIRRGDLVWARDEQTQENSLRPVVRTFVSASQPVLELTLRAETGGKHRLGTTDEHPFWVVGKGWVAARQLKPGDVLSSLDPDSSLAVKVLGQQRLPERATVYNFQVADARSYFVGSVPVWVHNTSSIGGGDAPSEEAGTIVEDKPDPRRWRRTRLVFPDGTEHLLWSTRETPESSSAPRESSYATRFGTQMVNFGVDAGGQRYRFIVPRDAEALKARLRELAAQGDEAGITTRLAAEYRKLIAADAAAETPAPRAATELDAQAGIVSRFDPDNNRVVSMVFDSLSKAPVMALGWHTVNGRPASLGSTADLVPDTGYTADVEGFETHSVDVGSGPEVLRVLSDVSDAVRDEWLAAYRADRRAGHPPALAMRRHYLRMMRSQQPVDLPESTWTAVRPHSVQLQLDTETGLQQLVARSVNGASLGPVGWQHAGEDRLGAGLAAKSAKGRGTPDVRPPVPDGMVERIITANYGDAAVTFGVYFPEGLANMEARVARIRAEVQDGAHINDAVSLETRTIWAQRQVAEATVELADKGEAGGKHFFEFVLKQGGQEIGRYEFTLQQGADGHTEVADEMFFIDSALAGGGAARKLFEGYLGRLVDGMESAPFGEGITAVEQVLTQDNALLAVERAQHEHDRGRDTGTAPLRGTTLTFWTGRGFEGDIEPYDPAAVERAPTDETTRRARLTRPLSGPGTDGTSRMLKYEGAPVVVQPGAPPVEHWETDVVAELFDDPIRFLELNDPAFASVSADDIHENTLLGPIVHDRLKISLRSLGLDVDYDATGPEFLVRGLSPDSRLRGHPIENQLAWAAGNNIPFRVALSKEASGMSFAALTQAIKGDTRDAAVYLQSMAESGGVRDVTLRAGENQHTLNGALVDAEYAARYSEDGTVPMVRDPGQSITAEELGHAHAIGARDSAGRIAEVAAAALEALEGQELVAVDTDLTVEDVFDDAGDGEQTPLAVRIAEDDSGYIMTISFRRGGEDQTLEFRVPPPEDMTKMVDLQPKWALELVRQSALELFRKQVALDVGVSRAQMGAVPNLGVPTAYPRTAREILSALLYHSFPHQNRATIRVNGKLYYYGPNGQFVSVEKGFR